jgi:hypothetical protein
LRADSADELHRFATEVGIARSSFVGNPTVEDLGYYDLAGRDRRRALKAGADALEWSDAYQRISEQMVAGTRRATSRHGRFGVTRPASRPTPATAPTTIDLRDEVRDGLPFPSRQQSRRQHV